MARNPGCTVFIGNLDDKVPERVLYEILIQVGRVVDLHIPRDKETSRPKGYAFAEYETEEIAQYAIKLFSGLVRLQNKTLRFAISGQDKPSSNGNIPVTPRLNSVPQPKQPQPMRSSDTPLPQHTAVNGRSAGYGILPNHSYDTHSQAPDSSGLPSRGLSNGTYEYSRRVFGSVLNDVSRRATREPVPYPSY
ncbi:spliceosome-associated protein 49-like isoform X1 [Miscanthus floridulus]|uniref:spliceosome-associated protein 49-like isoform X1 n=1 Tax=Miscanthus floridulus TaxID=154761 RepID=UPI003457CD41